MTPGLAKLTEDIATAALPGLSDDLWRLVYTRGHVDIDRARPSFERDPGGVLVYAHALEGTRALLVVDTGGRLVGAVAAVAPAPPRVGSVVRLASSPTSRKAAWRVVVDEPFPALLDVCFDRIPMASDDRSWIASFREALASIRAAEAVRREEIALRRRCVPPLAAVPTAEDVVRDRIHGLRREVERETAFTADEVRALDAARLARRAGTYGNQRRAYARETELARVRQERFDARMRERLAAVRAEVPALHARLREQHRANDAIRRELQRLEDAHIESRARTEATFAASRRLDALAGAPFVATLRCAPESIDDPAYTSDVLRTIDLLARALPRATASIAV